MAGDRKRTQRPVPRPRDGVDEDHAAVSEMLDREWDPIGVYDGPPGDQAPPGEYQTYAGWIVQALRSGGGRADIEEALHRALVRMGIGTPPESTRRTAELILDWWDARG